MLDVLSPQTIFVFRGNRVVKRRFTFLSHHPSPVIALCYALPSHGIVVNSQVLILWFFWFSGPPAPGNWFVGDSDQIKRDRTFLFGAIGRGNLSQTCFFFVHSSFAPSHLAPRSSLRLSSSCLVISQQQCDHCIVAAMCESDNYRELNA